MDVVEFGVDQIEVVPNPNSGHFTLQFEIQKAGTYGANLYNIQGLNVFPVFKDLYLNTGKQQQEISVDLPAGIYFLRIENEYQSYSKLIHIVP